MRTSRKLMTVLASGNLRYLPFSPTIVQNDGTLTAAGDTYTMTAQTTPAWGDQGFYGEAVTRANGLAVIGTLNLSTWGQMAIGFHSAAAVSDPATWKHGLLFSATSGQITNLGGGILISGLSTSTEYPFAVVLGATRTKMLLKVSGEWKTLWVSTDTTGTLYPCFANNGAAGSVTFRLANLPGAWASDYGVITNRLRGNRSNNEEFSHTADAVISFTMPAIGTTNSSFRFRNQDINNHWQIRIAGTTGVPALVRYLASVSATRATSATAITAGDRVTIAANGQTIAVYINNARVINWTTATEFPTLTRGKISLGTDASIANIEAWPLTLPTSAANILSRYAQVAQSGTAEATPPTDDRLWSFGWENNTITGASQWSTLQRIDVDRFAVVSDIARTGTYAARAEVRQGDVIALGERAEVSNMVDSLSATISENEASGNKYFAFSVRLEGPWQEPEWFKPIQLHGPDVFAWDPSVAIMDFGGQWGFLINGGDLDDVNNQIVNSFYPFSNSTITADVWVDFVFRVKFTVDWDGEVDVWRRDEGESAFTQVLTLRNIPTLQYKTSAFGNHYWKHGAYRKIGATFANAVRLDCMTRGVDFSAVVTAAWGG